MTDDERDVIFDYASRCVATGNWLGLESAAARLEPVDRSVLQDRFAIASTIVSGML